MDEPCKFQWNRPARHRGRQATAAMLVGVLLVTLWMPGATASPLATADSRTRESQLDTSPYELVIRLDPGTPPGSVGVQPPGPDLLPLGPEAVAVGPEGRIYLLDSLNYRVLGFDPDGALALTIEIEGAGYLKDLQLDSAGNLFVLDIARGQVLEFDAQGTWVRTLGANPHIQQGVSGIAVRANGDLVWQVDGSREHLLATRGGVLGNEEQLRSAAAGVSLTRGSERSIFRRTDSHSGGLTVDRGDGAASLEIRHRVAHDLGSMKLLGVDQAGNLYVMVEELLDNTSAVVVDTTVRRYSPAGEFLAVARLPVEEGVFGPFRFAAVDALGTVYYLLVETSGVRVVRPAFSQDLPALLDGKKGKQDVSLSEPAPTDLPLQEPEPIGRYEIVQRARSYVDLNWTCSEQNYAGAGCAGRERPGYLQIGQVTGIPYMWGGFNGLDQDARNNEVNDRFPDRMAAGIAAGDVHCDVTRYCAAGLDCSGFVSRAWRLAVKQNTGGLVRYSEELDSVWNLVHGDILNNRATHVVMFHYFTNEGSQDGVRTLECTTDNGGRCQAMFRTWTWLNNNGYRAYKRRNLDQVDAAIRAGLSYLRAHQRPDGGWGEAGSSTGITGLVTLAFLNYGFNEADPTDTDGDGTPDVREAVQFLLSHYDGATGRFWGDVPWGEPAYTYDTALGLLVLVAADRARLDPIYRPKIEGARNYLLSIQSVESNGYAPTSPEYGGWGYPRANWSDLSDTQWAVMALDAAYSYLGEPKPSPDDPASWTHKVLRYADAVQRTDGGFDYRQGWFGTSVGSMTHAGIWTNLLAGRDFAHGRVQQAMAWVQTSAHWTVSQNPNRGTAALYYYYVTLAKALTMARRTTLTVDDSIRDWYRELATELTTGGHAPHETGYWFNTDGDEWESDENLVTAYAILALETRLLPAGAALSMSIILHSPADLHLYDAEGRHTGLNYDTGELELEIPGSELVIGETQAVTVTSLLAGNYYVELVGTGEGDFQLDILGHQDGRMVQSTSYAGTIDPGHVCGSFLTVTAMEGALTIFSTQPAQTPVMTLSPRSTTLRGLAGSVAHLTFSVSESGGVQGVQDASPIASDLIGPVGGSIPGSSFDFTPATFDLPPGGSQLVEVELPIPADVEDGLFEGHITVESLNAGAKLLTLVVDVSHESPAYLPLVARSYSPAGSRWSTGTGLEGQTAYALALSPTDCNTAYAGTANGVYRTADRGRTWTPTGPLGLLAVPRGEQPFGRNGAAAALVSALAAHPANGQVVYAATWGAGVRKTTNAGSTWTPANAGLGDSLWLYALAFDASGGALYAGTGDDGVFKTTNGGASWFPANSGLGNLNIRALLRHPSNPQVLYAGTLGGVFNTTDGGGSWSPANAGLGASTVWSLSIDPTNPQVVYAGLDGAGAYKTLDGGVSWFPIRSGLGTPTVYGLAVDPDRPHVVFAGTGEQGVYYTKDAGANWAPTNDGLGNWMIQALQLDGAACHTLHAGTGDGVWEYEP